MPQLDALMPAHVIYDQIDPNPAGFSPFWIQEVLRNRLKFDGVLFSDDLSMQAACVAGGADARIQAALTAGCDMGLVCNDRSAACTALEGIANLELPNQERLDECVVKFHKFRLVKPYRLATSGKLSKQPLKSLKIRSKL